MVCVSWDEKGRITVLRILGEGWKCVLRGAVYFPDLRMLVGRPSRELSNSEFLFIMRGPASVIADLIQVAKRSTIIASSACKMIILIRGIIREL